MNEYLFAVTVRFGDETEKEVKIRAYGVTEDDAMEDVDELVEATWPDNSGFGSNLLREKEMAAEVVE